MVKRSELPFYFDGKCDDPFWNGCDDPVMYYRERVSSDKPDCPQFLCEECYEAEIDEGNINPEEWEMIEE